MLIFILLNMKVIIDERETELYDKCYSMLNEDNVSNNGVFLTKEVLQLGDIFIKTNDDVPVLLIERKTFADLLASVKDGRYEEQSYRLIHSSGFHTHNIIYLLEGMFSTLRTPIEKKLIYSCMSSLNYFKGFSVMRTTNVRETAEFILATCQKIEKDMVKGKTPAFKFMLENTPVSASEGGEQTSENITNMNTSMASNYCTVVKKVKKDNITPENIGEIILCQIPGISSTTAIAIMKNFNSFPHFIDEVRRDINVLNNVQLEANGKVRKINKSCIESIKQYLL